MRRKTVLLTLALLALPLVVLALGLVAARASRRPVEAGLVDGRLRPCPSTPNCVCSEGAEPSIEPLAFEGEPEAAFRSLLAFLDDEPRVQRVELDGDYAHYTFRTPLLGFVDDVELRLDRERGAIEVRSASRVGHSDLGTNRRRVESIRAEWSGGE
jgi:uncharacterized protein (DUF1499 family)